MKLFAAILLLVTFANSSFGQNVANYVAVKEVETVDYEKLNELTNKYVDTRLGKLDKLYKKQDKQLKKALQRLTKQEQKLKNKLKKKDSSAHAKLENSLSYDSLKNYYAAKKEKLQSCKVSRTTNKVLDSLSVMKKFTQKTLDQAKQNGLLKNDLYIPSADNQLADLKSKLALQDELSQLMSKQNDRLKNSLGQLGNVANLKGLNKTFFYYNQKAQVYKNMAKEPEKVEELALNYLKGLEGFETSLSNGLRQRSAEGGVSMQGMKPEGLKRMGFQTKQSIKENISQKFNLNNQEKTKAFKEKISQAKGEFNELKTQKAQVQKELKQIKEEGFKPNPMRGLPFAQRIEKNFNWQVKRAANAQPAIADFNFQVGFKHRERLTYNLLAGTAIGLGQDIRNIKLSWQGVRAGANVDWKWMWGLSAQAGYEALYKEYETAFMFQETTDVTPQLISQTNYLKHTAYAGIMKTYRLNKKYNGTILIAYDFLWNEYDKPSPILIRFGWKK